MNTRRGELYRNPSKGKIAGVCAGIADYFGWETWLIRILIVSAVLFGMPFFIFAYIAAWFILDKNPKQPAKHKNASFHHTAGENSSTNASTDKSQNNVDESIKVKARIWQSGEPPKQALYDIRKKFAGLENKLRVMEQYVTSSEFTVAREINKL